MSVWIIFCVQLTAIIFFGDRCYSLFYRPVTDTDGDIPSTAVGAPCSK
jgi:hypothetical protein